MTLENNYLILSNLKQKRVGVGPMTATLYSKAFANGFGVTVYKADAEDKYEIVLSKSGKVVKNEDYGIPMRVTRLMHVNLALSKIAAFNADGVPPVDLEMEWWKR